MLFFLMGNKDQYSNTVHRNISKSSNEAPTSKGDYDGTKPV